jgi:hypothetical protein
MTSAIGREWLQHVVLPAALVFAGKPGTYDLIVKLSQNLL